MHVDLIPISLKDKEKLSELLLNYKKELTGNPEEYKYLDSYFEEKGRHPFFIKVGDEVIGFVLVNEYTVILDSAKSIAEFYIEKKYRRKGCGKIAAKKVFNLFPGNWEIRQLNSNIAGQKFWTTIIDEYTNGNCQELSLKSDKWYGIVQVFNNAKLSK